MKKLLLALVLLLPMQVVAREPFNAELPMMCGNTDNLVTNLRDKYGEEIVMMAPSKNEYRDDLFHSL